MTRTLSLIVPTRRRVASLTRLLDSLRETTADPRALEVVLVIDADDAESAAFRFDGLALKRVVVEPGRTMGQLNRAGYEACSGDLLMLLNDDVIAGTRGWDAGLRGCFREYPDDILLAHVNDRLFGPGLCTFPVVSRTFCRLAGGICPAEYVRYRIDDHIEDVFNLLGALGERRIVYLPGVVFEHFRYAGTRHGPKNYLADEGTLALDAPRFEALLPARKELALRLKEHIAEQARTRGRSADRARLEPINDSLALRVPGRQRVRSGAGIDYAGDIPVTIGLLTPHSRARRFRACLDALRASTRNYELMILEDRSAAGGHRARALNRLLEAARPGYLVVLEDHVDVGPHWLWDLFRCLRTEEVALVTLLPPGRAGAPGYVLTACGPLLLIDTAKCTGLSFDEVYRSSLAATDFGLQVWEAGWEVVGVPLPGVSHRRPGPHALGGLTEEQWEGERQVFFGRWLESGRFAGLEARVGERLPELRPAAGLTDGARKRLLTAYQDLLLDIEQQRPAWRQTWLGRLRASTGEALWHLRGCWRRKGWGGLLRAAWRRLARVRMPLGAGPEEAALPAGWYNSPSAPSPALGEIRRG